MPSKRFDLLKSDIEFTTQLSIEDCQSRLTDMQADVWRVGSVWAIFTSATVGFLWYGKRKNFLTFLLQGPALVGSLTDTQRGTLIQADFRPYVSVAWTLVVGIGVLLFFILRQIMFAQASIQLLLFAALLLVVTLINWLTAHLFRPYWEDLAKRLRDTLPPNAER